MFLMLQIVISNIVGVGYTWFAYHTA